jgi:hypothetical protein
MSEASIFGEGVQGAPAHPPHQTGHGPLCCPAHGLFGAKAGAPCSSDQSALYGRVQSNSSASFTART